MKKEDVELIVVHCSATKPSMDVGAAEIRRWHRERGWLDIGYHFVIKRDGSIEEGRKLDVAGAHARNWNHCSLGICLVGGLSEATGKPMDNFTDAQMNTLQLLVRGLKNDMPRADVIGHRDLPGVKKACPCFDVKTWYKHVVN